VLFDILTRLNEIGLLPFIHPQLNWKPEYECSFSKALNYAQNTAWKLPASIGNTSMHHALLYLVWLAQPENAAGCDVGLRLRLSRPILETLEKITVLVNSSQDWKDLPSSQITRELDKLPIYGVFALFCITGDHILKHKLETYATSWRFITPGLNGNDLRARGIPPGPLYARILAEIRDAWLDGRITTGAEEVALVESLIKESNDRKDL